MNLEINKMKQDLRRCEKMCRILQAQAGAVDGSAEKIAELEARVTELSNLLNGRNMKIGRLEAQLKRIKEKEDA